MFDPISARDYYALAGIFKSTQTVEHANVSKWLLADLPAVTRAEKDAIGAHAIYKKRLEQIARLVDKGWSNHLLTARGAGDLGLGGASEQHHDVRGHAPMLCGERIVGALVEIVEPPVLAV